MIIVAICELFGWDYYTYMSQPKWFIDLIKAKMTVDAQKAKDIKV